MKIVVFLSLVLGIAQDVFGVSSVTTSVVSSTRSVNASTSSKTSSVSSTTTSVGASSMPYWLENIKYQGISAFNANSSTYQVFRNVKDFGAKGWN